MNPIGRALLAFIASLFRSRMSLQLEIVALRHQLAMDCPDARPVQPPEQGAAVAFPEVGGLHHHYERVAA